MGIFGGVISGGVVSTGVISGYQKHRAVVCASIEADTNEHAGRRERHCSLHDDALRSHPRITQYSHGSRSVIITLYLAQIADKKFTLCGGNINRSLLPSLPYPPLPLCPFLPSSPPFSPSLSSPFLFLPSCPLLPFRLPFPQLCFAFLSLHSSPLLPFPSVPPLLFSPFPFPLLLFPFLSFPSLIFLPYKSSKVV